MKIATGATVVVNDFYRDRGPALLSTGLDVAQIAVWPRPPVQHPGVDVTRAGRWRGAAARRPPR
jgi:hypothetical protein